MTPAVARDERLDLAEPVETSPWPPDAGEIDPNQTWRCERCPTVTADPLWRDGQIVCAGCARAAHFKPAEEIECPF